ncbi:uncharacterized protein LOC144129539 [Amblyomma americanum]
MAAARIQRWAVYLGGYNYKLQYVPGKQLLNSDALSRLTQQTTRDGGEGPTEGSHDWTRPPDSSLYVRNYGQGEKWIPGHVKSATGARMVTIEPPTAIVKRHVDQVRRRSDSSPRIPVTDTTARGPGPRQTKGPSTAANVTTPLEAAAPDESPDTAQIAGNNIQPLTSLLPPTLRPAEASQQAVRRSTRQRKPVQRFNFGGEGRVVFVMLECCACAKHFNSFFPLPLPFTLQVIKAITRPK